MRTERNARFPDAPGSDAAVAIEVLRDYRTALRRAAGLDLAAARLLAPDAQAQSHRIYLCLLHGLSGAFPGVERSRLPLLAVAAYGTYRMLLEVDALVDEIDTGVLPAMLHHQQVVSDALGDAFGREQPRHEWQLRWSQQWAAIRTERGLGPGDCIDDDAYRRLAAGKSGMVALAVDWLDRLAPQPGRARWLREALTGMHVGMQWIDDLRDFEADAACGQRTLIRDRHAELMQEQGLATHAIDPALARRMLFASGLAEALVAEALDELTVARACAEQGGSDWLAGIIGTLIQRAIAFSDAIVVQRTAASRCTGASAGSGRGQADA